MSTVTEYNSDLFPGIAKKFCELSTSRRELAEVFTTDECQIEEWQKDYPEFSAACNAGYKAARERLLDKVLKSVTNSPRKKIINICGTPAQILVNEESRINLAAVMWLFAYYERNEAFSESPLVTLYRHIQGTAIRPKE